MIIAAVKLSDIELDVDAERAKPSGNEAGQVVSFGIYITAIPLLAPRFITEIIERKFPRDVKEKKKMTKKMKTLIYV